MSEPFDYQAWAQEYLRQAEKIDRIIARMREEDKSGGTAREFKRRVCIYRDIQYDLRRTARDLMEKAKKE